MAKERHREKERKRDRKGETLNHLSIHQWVRSATFASHQLTSPTGFPWFSIFETSATALCGTSAVLLVYIYIHMDYYVLYDVICIFIHVCIVYISIIYIYIYKQYI